MTDPEIVLTAAEEFEEQLRATKLPDFVPLPASISPWVAASLLQKSIRRGLGGWATAASNALLAVAPERLWRRLVIIAIEDVGVGGIDVLYQTIAAACLRSRLTKRYDPRLVASVLAYRLAMSSKCRACNDLIFVVEEDPTWESSRLEFAAATSADLYRVILEDPSVHRRVNSPEFSRRPRLSFSAAFRTRRVAASRS